MKQLNNQKFPQEWKNSVNNMIPKKNKNSSNPKEYRSISLTNCVAKLAERLMLSKTKQFMEIVFIMQFHYSYLVMIIILKD
jgi:hypothetical protein